MHGLGAKLQAIREKRGLTQRELAARIHKSTPAVSAYETDAQTPPTDVLISIAQVLHVPVTYLLDCGNEDTYSAAGLTDAQKEAVDLLFAEFAEPSNAETELSARQLEIIRRLMRIFSDGS